MNNRSFSEDQAQFDTAAGSRDDVEKWQLWDGLSKSNDHILTQLMTEPIGSPHGAIEVLCSSITDHTVVLLLEVFLFLFSHMCLLLHGHICRDAIRGGVDED